MERFELVSPFQPTGDQPSAIEQLVQGIYDNKRHQVLLGATGTGKTKAFSQIIWLNILYPTLIFINQKRIYQEPIPILIKMRS